MSVPIPSTTRYRAITQSLTESEHIGMLTGPEIYLFKHGLERKNTEQLITLRPPSPSSLEDDFPESARSRPPDSP